MYRHTFIFMRDGFLRIAKLTNKVMECDIYMYHFNELCIFFLSSQLLNLHLTFLISLVFLLGSMGAEKMPKRKMLNFMRCCQV
jgi:hypothetical protein